VAYLAGKALLNIKDSLQLIVCARGTWELDLIFSSFGAKVAGWTNDGYFKVAIAACRARDAVFKCLRAFKRTEQTWRADNVGVVAGSVNRLPFADHECVPFSSC
jgi:hypothetical protein